MIKTQIKVFNRFPEITRTVEQLAQRAVTEAAEEAASTARSIGGSRGLTDIDVVPAHGTEIGYAAGIVGRWYYRFHSFGTLGKAVSAKRPGSRRSHAPGTGIEPNFMFQRARTAGRARLRRVLDQHFR